MSNTEEQVRNAIAALLSVCDGAREDDGRGFNGQDAGFARALHIQPRWTEKQLFQAHKMLCKYKNTQLPNFGIDYDSIPQPPKPVSSSDKPKLSWDPEAKIFTVKAHFCHRQQLVAIPTARFDKETTREWKIPANLASVAAIKGLREKDFFDADGPSVEVLNAIHTVAAVTPEPFTRSNFPELDFDGTHLLLRSPFSFKEVATSIPNRRWNPELKVWRYLPTAEVVDCWNKIFDEQEVELTEAARAFFNKMAAEQLKQRDQKIAAKNIKNGEVPDIPVPLKTIPFNHQKRAFAIATTLDHSALLMQQGTGKTLSAIAAVGKRYLDGTVKKLLVVCPKSVIDVWVGELKKHADFPVQCFPLNQKKMSLKKETILSAVPNGSLTVIITNYASSWRMVEELKHWAPDAMILDESQSIKNNQSQQTKGCISIGDVAKYRMILTGTPISQGPLDFFSQFRYLDSRVFGKSFKKFRDQYAIMGGFQNHEVVGFKNLETLTARAHSISYRVTKEEALDLPPTIDQNLYAYLDESLGVYSDMEKKMVVTLKEGNKVTAPIVLVQMLRLAQISGGFLPDENGDAISVGNEKLTVFKEFLEDFPKEKKLVVVARFVSELLAIKEVCKQLNRSAELLYGATTNRGELVRRFQEETDPNIIIIQTQTGGTGITLHKADTMVFYSLDFSFMNYDQVKSRVHRIGTVNKVTYLHIISKNTIDEVVLEALQNKRDVADLLVDKMKNNSLF